MLINEIFDTKPNVTWNHQAEKHQGTFELEGVTYIVKADEWTLTIPTLPPIDFLDVEFVAIVGGQHTLAPTGLYKGAKVFGAFINSIRPLIKQLSPESIVFSAKKSDPLYESRMSLYRLLCETALMKHGNFTNLIENINTNIAIFTMVSKIHYTNEQVTFVKQFIADNIQPK